MDDKSVNEDNAKGDSVIAGGQESEISGLPKHHCSRLILAGVSMS